MPYRPAHPCKYPGCPGLTHTKYCAKHAYLEHEADREYNATRDKSVKKFYGAEWTKIRDQYLIEHPYCETCRQNHKLVRAEHVHHIVAIRDGGTNDEENLVSLCKGCHTQQHGKQGDYKKKYRVYTY